MKIKQLNVKVSDIKKALIYLTLGSELVVVRKNQYALEAKHLDNDNITLIIYREQEVGSEQYSHYTEFKLMKNELLEVLYA